MDYIPAYTGDEPYIFISYSHQDSSIVMNVIKSIIEMGFRVWYDEGIELGQDFPTDIANKIENCTQFVPFISKSSVNSWWVKKEIKLAEYYRRKIMPIYLEETILAKEIEHIIAIIQGIMKYKVTDDLFQRYLIKGLKTECKNHMMSTGHYKIEGHELGCVEKVQLAYHNEQETPLDQGTRNHKKEEIDIIISTDAINEVTRNEVITWDDTSKESNKKIKCVKEEEFEANLFLINLDGKYGYMNNKGKMIIPPQYDDGFDFDEGVATVQINDKWGVINIKGEIIIPAKYAEPVRFSEKLAEVIINGKWGYINKCGEMIIPAQYNNAKSFSEGLAGVEINGKWGYIIKSGEMIIPAQYEDANSFSEGLAGVKIDCSWGCVWGYIKKNGEIVIPPKYTECGVFHEGIVEVENSNGWVLIDKNDNILTSLAYKSIGPFFDGLAMVSEYRGYDNTYGYVNGQGKLTIPRKYRKANDFSEGLAAVNENGYWGFINKEGIMVIPAQYNFATDFSEGLAAVNKNGRWEFIDHNGSTIILFEFSKKKYSMYYNGFRHGICRIDSMNDESISYIDKKGNVIEPQF